VGAAINPLKAGQHFHGLRPLMTGEMMKGIEASKDGQIRDRSVEKIAGIFAFKKASNAAGSSRASIRG